jgi:pantothenate kinase type III
VAADRRSWGAYAAATASGSAAATSTAGAATTTGRAAASASAAGLAAATAAASAAATTATRTASARTASAARASRAAGHHTSTGGIKGMIRGSAEGIKNSYNDESDSYNQEGIFRGVLPGLLSPEPFEGRQHDNTFFGGRTLDIQGREKPKAEKKLHEIKYHRVTFCSRRVSAC